MRDFCTMRQTFRPALATLAGVALLLLAGAGPAGAQVEVPVSFDVGDGVLQEAVLVGGSLVAEEGLHVTPLGATATRVLAYDKIDELASVTVRDGRFACKVHMDGGVTFEVEDKAIEGQPFLVFHTGASGSAAVASGTAAASGSAAAGSGGEEAAEPVERRLDGKDLAALAQLSFEAEPVFEVDVPGVKALDAEFLKAVEAGDVSRAIDLHNQIGEKLGENEGDDEGTASESAAADDDEGEGSAAGAGAASEPTKP